MRRFFSTQIFKRCLTFVFLFSIVPALAAWLSLALGAGPQMSALRSAFQSDSGWAARTALGAVSASLLVAVVLALTSFWAWRESDGHHVLRALRALVGLGGATLALHPGFWAHATVVRSIPLALLWMIGASLFGLLLLWKPARPSRHELLWIVAFLALWLTSFRSTAFDFTARAGRDLTSRDTLLFGFDSVSGDDVQEALAAFQPRAGTKVVYTNAYTPVAITSAAWRSALSGLFPSKTSLLPGTTWASDSPGWLPAQAARLGIHTTFFQDSPSTNIFAPAEQVEVRTLQGWKFLFWQTAWKALFPLSTVGAPWWVDALGGPAGAPSQYTYCPDCFWNRTLAQVADTARTGPVLFAAHSCFAHPAIHLELEELWSLPHWWLRPPIELEGSDLVGVSNVTVGQDLIWSARTIRTKRVLSRLLHRLDDSGILGKANVVILSDHGARASWFPKIRTHHIMLTTFTPGPREDRVIIAPVVMADLAPTVRAWLGIPFSEPEDVRPLPTTEPAQWPAREWPMFAVPTLNTLGLAPDKSWSKAADELIRFNGDGTYVFSELLQRRSGGRDDVGMVPQQEP